MKNIQIKNILNKDANSMTTLKIDEQEIPLTEKEVKTLFEQLYENRPDIFEEVVGSLLEEIEELTDNLNDAESQIDNLKDELKFYEDSED